LIDFWLLSDTNLPQAFIAFYLLGNFFITFFFYFDWVLFFHHKNAVKPNNPYDEWNWIGALFSPTKRTILKPHHSPSIILWKKKFIHIISSQLFWIIKHEQQNLCLWNWCLAIHFTVDSGINCGFHFKLPLSVFDSVSSLYYQRTNYTKRLIAQWETITILNKFFSKNRARKSLSEKLLIEISYDVSLWGPNKKKLCLKQYKK
jgi:hypothetical protein